MTWCKKSKKDVIVLILVLFGVSGFVVYGFNLFYNEDCIKYSNSISHLHDFGIFYCGEKNMSYDGLSYAMMWDEPFAEAPFNISFFCGGVGYPYQSYDNLNHNYGVVFESFNGVGGGVGDLDLGVLPEQLKVEVGMGGSVYLLLFFCVVFLVLIVCLSDKVLIVDEECKK